MQVCKGWEEEGEAAAGDGKAWQWWGWGCPELGGFAHAAAAGADGARGRGHGVRAAGEGESEHVGGAGPSGAPYLLSLVHFHETLKADVLGARVEAPAPVLAARPPCRATPVAAPLLTRPALPVRLPASVLCKARHAGAGCPSLQYTPKSPLAGKF